MPSREVSDTVFNELKTAAIDIWMHYDDEFGYVKHKLAKIERTHNVSDNYGTFIGMFDVRNQEKLYAAVGDEAKALIDGWVGNMAGNIKMAKEYGIY